MKQDFVKGISWLGAGKVITRAVALAKTAILARILSPAAFGLFGVASIVLNLLEVITETGINVFLVQEKRDVDEYVDTAWLVSITRGILISLLIVLLAGSIAGFFGSPGARNLILLIALVPLIRGFINPSVVKFQKELPFHKEFYFRTLLFVVDAAAAVGFSLLTHSPAAIVWGMVAGAMLEVLLSFLIVKPTPKFKFDFGLLKAIVNRGKWITLAGTFEYFFLHGDDIVVGRVLGVTPLGLYQVGYRISILPITEIADVFGRVAFPSYVKIIDDPVRLKRVFTKIVGGIALLVIPFGIILFVFAEPLVRIVLGSQWLGVIPALKVLAIYGTVKALIYPAYAVFFAAKKQNYVTYATLAGILGLFGSILPLVAQFGIVGAALAALIGTLVTIPVITVCLVKTFKA